MRARWLGSAAVAAAAFVCLMRTPSAPDPLHPISKTEPPAEAGRDHDPTRCGSLSGQVLWAGPAPAPAAIRALEPGGSRPTEARPNPNAPRLTDSGVADAAVWLEPVNVSRSRPWHHAPVSVEAAEPDFVVRQGDARVKVGIVRRGDAVSFLSREARLHSARARGPVFFTQMLPEPGRPVGRTMDRSGAVELTSASGYYWMRAYLVVSDHPYVAVTRSDGSYRFDSVPDGSYELVCWKANWHIDRLEHDPETAWPVRLLFRPPVELRQPVRVSAGRPESASFTLSAGLFGPG